MNRWEYVGVVDSQPWRLVQLMLDFGNRYLVISGRGSRAIGTDIITSDTYGSYILDHDRLDGDD